MDFQSEVIQRSYEIPVLVDFWAPWCGPCRFIGPVLEELAKETVKWELVKVNVDENREISTRYSIMGIPAIKLFSNGEVIGEFSGALPRAAVVKWLDENLPDESREELHHILERSTDIPDQSLIERLTTFILKNPGNKEAHLNLARHLVFSSPEDALTHVENISIGDESYEVARHIRTLHRFLTASYSPGTSIGATMNNARSSILKGDLEAGIEAIIEASAINKNFMDDLPRLTAIAIFEIIGRLHPLTRNYRRKFDMVLY